MATMYLFAVGGSHYNAVDISDRQSEIECPFLWNFIQVTRLRTINNIELF